MSYLFFFLLVLRSYVREIVSGMARRPMARTWMSNASSEFLILLLCYILKLGRGVLEILEKLVMSVGKRIFLLRYEWHAIFLTYKNKLP